MLYSMGSLILSYVLYFHSTEYLFIPLILLVFIMMTLIFRLFASSLILFVNLLLLLVLDSSAITIICFRVKAV